MDDVRCIYEAKSELGEGTLWDPVAGVLWWVDIWGKLIHRYDPSTGKRDTYETPEYVGCLAVREKGGLVVTMVTGYYFFDPSSGIFTHIIDPESDNPDTRFNDGKPDRNGRFWAGTVFEKPGSKTEFVCGLYRLDPDNTCHKMVSGIGSSNGLAFSPDSRTLYFADSQKALVWAWDMDPLTGDIDNRRVFIDTKDLGGLPDGATIDSEGCYWTTLPEGGKIARFDPDGALMRMITIPTSIPTCCEFGGPNLDILYVTSATLRKLDDRYAGALFAIDVGVRGLTLSQFKG